MAEGGSRGLKRMGVGRRQRPGTGLLSACSGQETQGVSDHPKSTVASQVAMKVHLLRNGERIYFM